MDDNFNHCLKQILHHEGGWSNNPLDPGGATMKGITLRTFRRFEPTATKEDLKNISDDSLARIYRVDYFNAAKCGDLPRGVDLIVFDAAVNQGVSAATKMLQKSVGAYPDGIIGPMTLGNITMTPVKTLLIEFAARRMVKYALLAIFKPFGLGWSRRLFAVFFESVKLAWNIRVES